MLVTLDPVIQVRGRGARRSTNSSRKPRPI